MICLSFLSACQAEPAVMPQKNQPLTLDSVVYANLGKTVSETLFSPTKVRCFRLKGVSTVEEGQFEVEPHWVRDTMLAELTPQMYGVLQFALLANPNSYVDDSNIVRSPYVPMIEFEFTNKKTVVHVLISTSDYTWTIMYDDKRQLNYNYADKALIGRFCDYFFNIPKINNPKEHTK